MRCFGDPKDTIDSKQLKNQIYLLRFGHTSALIFKKKTQNGHFPRPRETDPYAWREKLIKMYQFIVPLKLIHPSREDDIKIYQFIVPLKLIHPEERSLSKSINLSTLQFFN